MKYNLIIITPDQLRADYLSCYGHPAIGTKNIDRLSDSGVQFENCYCAAPLCGPSRISFATSTYLSEHNHRNYWSTISPDVPNLVTSLKKAGYRTGMFGKNHLFTYDRLPELWDELDEICLGNYDGHPEYHHSYSSFTLEKDHKFNVTERLTQEAIDFVSRENEKPFFAWINYQDPHPAFCCPPPYDTLFDEQEITLGPAYHEYSSEKQPIRNAVWRTHSEMDTCNEMDVKKAIAHYMGQIRYVDDCVGKVLDSLKHNNLEDNTIILFFSDHGELLGDYNMMHKIPAFYDSLTRIPVILHHPTLYKGVKFTGLLEEVDIVPTLLEMMNVEIPPTMVGNSWVKCLDEKNYSGKQNIICEAGGGAPTCPEAIEGMKLVAPHIPTSFGPGAMIREGNFKLSIYHDDRCELYDLSTDPHELLNLYGDEHFEDIQNRLSLQLLKRILGTKVRRIDSLEWVYPAYPNDVRFEPLESYCSPTDTSKV